jgi:hypothetical protein
MKAIEEIQRYTCGNGEGMFYDDIGGFVSFDDYKKLATQIEQLKKENGKIAYYKKILVG